MSRNQKRAETGTPRPDTTRRNEMPAQAGTEAMGNVSLNHRTESLVAMDNPDDSQLGAGPEQKAGRQP